MHEITRRSAGLSTRPEENSSQKQPIQQPNVNTDNFEGPGSSATRTPAPQVPHKSDFIGNIKTRFFKLFTGKKAADQATDTNKSTPAPQVPHKSDFIDNIKTKVLDSFTGKEFNFTALNQAKNDFIKFNQDVNDTLETGITWARDDVGKRGYESWKDKQIQLAQKKMNALHVQFEALRKHNDQMYKGFPDNGVKKDVLVTSLKEEKSKLDDIYNSTQQLGSVKIGITNLDSVNKDFQPHRREYARRSSDLDDILRGISMRDQI